MPGIPGKLNNQVSAIGKQTRKLAEDLPKKRKLRCVIGKIEQRLEEMRSSRKIVSDGSVQHE